jgi:HPt (histidine-containing phosphotransfer) domain-containing protein
MESDRQVCLDSGMDDYLSKPINPVELFAAIERARILREERLATWQESALPHEPADSRPALTVLDSLLSDPASLARAPQEKIGVEAAAGPNWDGSVLLPDEPMDIELSVEHVGDRKFWLELVEVFLGEMPARIDTLRAAIESGDCGEVENLAHSIKGSCAEMLAEPMRQVALALELAGREERLADAPELLDGLIDSYRELEEILLRERTLVA